MAGQYGPAARVCPGAGGYWCGAARYATLTRHPMEGRAMTDTIKLKRHGHVGRIVIDKAESHNALGREELEGLQAALERVAGDDQLRVLVLTAAGQKTFCAGLLECVFNIFAGEIRSSIRRCHHL